MRTSPSLVCVVDDDASVRRSLQRLLDSGGFAVEVFPTARDYLERPPHNGPSCLVLDVMMPGLNGLDLHQQLIERGREEHVIYITGVATIPASVLAMKAGAVDFLSKPFKDGDFLEAVARALARSAQQRERQAERDQAREQLATLTLRERQVLQGVISGKMNKEIASDLGTSVRTIKVQRGNVMKKTGMTSVADLVRLARRAGG